MLLTWNKEISDFNEYLVSMEGLKNLAASSMLIEAIGEGVTKISHRLPGFLEKEKPEVEWQQIKGMRNRIAHGYFDIDAEHVFTIVKSDIAPLKDALTDLKEILESMEADYHFKSK